MLNSYNTASNISSAFKRNQSVGHLRRNVNILLLCFVPKLAVRH